VEAEDGRRTDKGRGTTRRREKKEKNLRIIVFLKKN
jgi:hypothetical protein